jgi:transposase
MSKLVEIRGLLSVLSPREEEVLLLRLEALKYREIADHLGISMNSVNALLARALRKLQTAMLEKTNVRKGYSKCESAGYESILAMKTFLPTWTASCPMGRCVRFVPIY